jgi:single-strand DNA-binding protein
MKMYLNRAQLIGHLTADPQLRYTASSMPVCTFSVATSFGYDRNGERKQTVDFHNCEAWDVLAENVAKHLTKGALVYLEGRLRTESWDGACGKKHFRTKFMVERCSFGPKVAKAVQQGEQLEQEATVTEREPGADDDVSF